MKDNERALQVYGNPSVLKKCVIDPKFAYVVALSRALNALNSALILKDPSGQKLEQMHLRSVRDGGVFHFLPDRFADREDSDDGVRVCYHSGTAEKWHPLCICGHHCRRNDGRQEDR